jgi:hypothetical protein
MASSSGHRDALGDEARAGYCSGAHVLPWGSMAAGEVEESGSPILASCTASKKRETQMTRYIGLDADSESCTIAVLGQSGKRLRRERIRTSAELLKSFI